MSLPWPYAQNYAHNGPILAQGRGAVRKCVCWFADYSLLQVATVAQLTVIWSRHKENIAKLHEETLHFGMGYIFISEDCGFDWEKKVFRWFKCRNYLKETYDLISPIFRLPRHWKIKSTNAEKWCEKSI